MKVATFIIGMVLLCTVLPAFGQADYGEDDYDNWYDDYDDYDDYDNFNGANSYSNDEYVCYQCPVCGNVLELTPFEAAYTDPYALCPYCFNAYAWQFIQISCQSGSEYPENGQYQEQNSEVEDIEVEYPPSISNNADTVQQLEGKILMVVPKNDYQDDEFEIPKDHFISRGLKVIVASKGTVEATSSGGDKVPVDVDVKNVDLSQYEAVVFVGGMGIEHLNMYEDSDYIDLAKSANQAGIVIGAICLAPKILANAELLDGVDATSSDPNYIKAKGANLVNQDVVTDGYIVTGNGPDASQSFAEAVVSAL